MVDFSKANFKDESFQLYFAGGWNKEVDVFLQDHNLNRLGSQLGERPLFEDWMKAKMEGKGGHLFVDSGAWSAHSKGVELDIDEYISYVNDHDDYFYIFAQGDTIPGKFRQVKTYQEKMQAPEKSWENYLYMVERVKSTHKLLPIFHQGEEFKWLKNILSYTDDYGNHIPYIGLSPANDSGVPMKIEFLRQCFSIIKESDNPDVRTHAFGMTSLDVLEKFPLTSADSTSWIMCAANGGVYTSFGVITVSEKSDSPTHYRHLSIKEKKAIDDYIESYGYTTKEASEDYKVRMKLNILYLIEWMKNYTYKPYKSTGLLLNL